MQKRRSLLGLGAGLALLGGTARVPAAESAAAYPGKPIRLVVPLAAGGAIEVIARMFGERLTKVWGQPVIVESKPGGNGMIGALAVSQSPPDGYTVLFTNSGLIQNAHLRPNPNFRFENYVPVNMMAYAPGAFAIQAAIPANTLAEFVDYVKARPGKVSFGSYGAGSSGHLLGEMLNKTAGLDMVHVAYRGESAAVQDMLGGRDRRALRGCRQPGPSIGAAHPRHRGRQPQAPVRFSRAAHFCRCRLSRHEPVGLDGDVHARRHTIGHRAEDVRRGHACAGSARIQGVAGGGIRTLGPGSD